MKWLDADRDGVKDSGEPGLSGWQITLDGAGLSLSTVTDQYGEYLFSELPAGDYTVAEVMQPGWQQSFPSGGTHTFMLADGQVVTDQDFGNFRAIYLPMILKPSPPVTKELIATHDSGVLQGYPTLNFGDANDMWAGYDDLLNPDGKIARSFVRFNLSSIPVGSDIHEARLFLYLVGSWDFENRYRTISIRRATSSWSESSVTWNSKPGYGEQYDAVSIRESAWGWYAFDITALVQGWVDGSFANHGLVVRGPEKSGSDSSWRAFGTSESSDKPFIRVTYLSSTSALAAGAPDVEVREQDSGASIGDLLTSDAPPTRLPKALSRFTLD